MHSIKSPHSFAHTLLAYLGPVFALSMIGVCGLPLSVKCVLIAAVILNVAWVKRSATQGKALAKFFSLANSNEWLMTDAVGQSHLAQLTSDIFLSQLIIIARWKLVAHKKTQTMILFSWHYDAQTWRRYNLLFLRHSE